MTTFCGALNFEGGSVCFSELQKMRTERGAGCAFINGEYGVLCYGDSSFLQPVSLKYNNHLYAAVIIADSDAGNDFGTLAESVLIGYIEEGEEYLGRLNFGFSLALYDKKCGELLLLKGGDGDKSLFYTVRDGGIYFSSSLACLMRLYGGCVRIDKDILREYIMGEHLSLPYGLFKDIVSIRAGQGVLWTRWGMNDVYIKRASFLRKRECVGEELEYSPKNGMLRSLTDSLFSFSYPQFDFCVPAILQRIDAARESGEKRICIELPILSDSELYFLERAESFFCTWGVEIEYVKIEKKATNKRALKCMDKSLDDILKDLVSDSACILHKLGADVLENARNEQDVALRIRKKGLLCQTAIWFEKFNVVLV